MAVDYSTESTLDGSQDRGSMSNPRKRKVASQWLRTSKYIRQGRETTEGTNHVAKAAPHPHHVAGWSSGQKEQTHYKPEAISSPYDWCSHTLYRRCALPWTFPQAWYSSLLDFSLPSHNPTLWETFIPWSPRRKNILTLTSYSVPHPAVAPTLQNLAYLINPPLTRPVALGCPSKRVSR